jgi:hypothetical protein
MDLWRKWQSDNVRALGSIQILWLCHEALIRLRPFSIRGAISGAISNSGECAKLE